MVKAFYVPWLHMHQPLVWTETSKGEALTGNLEKMLSSQDSSEANNARLMLRAYNNPAKFVMELKEKGFDPKIMVDFSGLLLESLGKIKKGTIVDGEKMPDFTKRFKEALTRYPSNIEVVGTAYSHCYFPATPDEDWVMQIEEWRDSFKRLFGSACLKNVKGFWFPEMGIPAFQDKLDKLVELLSEYYEWCILPIQAVDGYEQLSYSKRVQISTEPHLLKAKGVSLPVIFNIPSDFIDQQAGCEANLVVSKAREAAKIHSEVSGKPALVVPVSDGENGNVMMNEFFPKTFVPFFQSKKGASVSSLTVSEFLHEFYENEGKISPKDEIKVKIMGASWVGGHKQWLEGPKRQEMASKIADLSTEFHKKEAKIGAGASKNELEELKRLLLIAETSCYVYWGTDFWFDEGERTMSLLKKKIDSLKENGP